MSDEGVSSYRQSLIVGATGIDGISSYYQALALRAAGDRGSLSEARGLLLRAAGRTHPHAQYLLGVILLGGEGGPADPAAGRRWLDLAAVRSEQARVFLTVFKPDGRPSARMDFASLRRELSRKAKAGEAEAQVKLGLLYMDGHGGPVDSRAAMAWFEKAARMGHLDSAYLLATLSLDGSLFEPKGRSGASGWTWMRKAADAGHPAALTFFGEAAATAREKESYYRKAATKGHAEAQFKLGVLAARSDDDRETEAIKWLESAARKGHVQACEALGDLYARGYKVQNRALAINWYETAARPGSAEAMESLGALLFGSRETRKQAIRWLLQAMESGADTIASDLAESLGPGPAELDLALDLVLRPGHEDDRHAARTLKRLLERNPDHPFDYSRIVPWVQQGAAAGSGMAAGILADLLDRGKGMAKNPEKAVQWYRVAAERGDASAQAKLARAELIRPAGTDAEAVEALQRAVALGSLEARRELGLRYLEGRGVPKDVQQGVALIVRAADGGDPQAAFLKGRFLCEGVGMEPNLRTGIMTVVSAAKDSKGARDYLLDWGWTRKHDVRAADLKRRAEAGEAHAQVDLGLRYLAWANATDPEEGLEWLRKAARSGHSGAQFELGQWLSGLTGPSITVDAGGGRPTPEKGLPFLEMAAAQGHVPAKQALARVLSNLDSGRSIAILTELALAGDTKAQLDLGTVLIKEGQTAAGREWYRRAGDGGNVEGYKQLAAGYDYDVTTAREDPASAFPWHLKAATLGDVNSMEMVAARLKEGHGVKQDPGAAFLWFKRLSSDSSLTRETAMALTELFQSGPEDIRNAEEALRWAMTAVFLSHVEQSAMSEFGPPEFWPPLKPYITTYGRLANAVFAVALMLETGKGLPKDPGEAYLWYGRVPVGEGVGAGEVAALARFKRARLFEQGFGKAGPGYPSAFVFEEAVTDLVPEYRGATRLVLLAADSRLAFLEHESPLATKKLAELAPLLMEAARNGSPRAHYDLAMFSAHGRGVKRSVPTAIKHLEEAAGKGYVPALCRLAEVLSPEIGGKYPFENVPPDPKRALKYWQQAADRALGEVRSGPRFDGWLPAVASEPKPYPEFAKAVSGPDFASMDSPRRPGHKHFHSVD